MGTLADARQIPAESTLTYDVCVIGGGAAGISAAMELRGGPLRVCLLESGGLASESPTQSLYQGEVVGHSYYPLEGPRTRYLGGTTNQWSGDCRPFERVDFAQRPWVPFSGWPLEYEELEHHYARAHQLLELGPYTYEADDWSRGQAKPLPFDVERLVTKVCQYSPPTRFGTRYRGDLKSAPNVDTYLYANATEISGATDTFAVVHVACLSGTRFKVRARAVVIATGGIENARLLLASRQDYREGLGNQSDLVGRYFMEHLSLDAGLMVPAASDLRSLDLYELPRRRLSAEPRQGVNTKGYIMFSAKAMQRLGILNVSITFGRLFTPPALDSEAVQALRGVSSPVDLWRHLGVIARGWEHVVSSIYWKLFDVGRPLRAYGIRFQVEQAPNPDSRVQLSEQRDALGNNRAKLDWRLTELEYHTIRMASRQLAVEFGRLGLGRVQPWCANESDAEIDRRVLAGAHHMGTTRMDGSPGHGVVDTNCRVHGSRNVYVAGSSIFPTGGHSAPTVTVVALAVRLARHLRSELA